MLLKNKEDGYKYRVSSEDAAGLIRIYAVPCNPNEAKVFVMHYDSLAKLTNEWEDVGA